MNKHACLIVAYNNFYILKKLLKCIDNIRNDIYVHIDKKVKNFDFNYFKSLVKNSEIYFVDRVRVGLGSYTQIKAELISFKTTSKYNYKYYHLISGVDLPIKSQDYIHEFFHKLDGTEFLTVLKPEFSLKQNKLNRVDKYYLFQQFRRDNLIIYKINKLSIWIQNKLNISRNDDKIPLYYGSNWSRLTYLAVKAILNEEKWIEKTLKYTLCCDEV